MKRRFVSALVLLLALVPVAAACNDPGVGFELWVTNKSESSMFVAFRGSASLGDVDDPSAATYEVDPGAKSVAGPFIYVHDDSGTGSVILMSESCDRLQSWELKPGDYGLTIDAAGAIELHEYGFLDRPTNQDSLPMAEACEGS